MIRLIAIDMDGTILSPDHSISTKNKEAILAAQKNGIEVVIATGRSYPEAFEPIHEAGIYPSFICINGAEVRDKDGELISETHIMEEDIHKVTSILDTGDIDYQLFIEKTVYTRDAQAPIDTFIQLAEAANQVPQIDEIRSEIMDRVERGIIQEVESFETLIGERKNSIYKIFGTSFDRESLDRAREALQQLPGLAVSSSGAGNLEITSVHAQKGIAVEQYAKIKGIPMDQVMAIGDNYNDLSMMKVAGRSVAMGNAPDEIKAACTHVTTANDEDGVGRAIESILQLQN